MLLVFTVLLFFHLQLSSALNLHIDRLLPRLVKAISPTVFSHGVYVDDKVHQTPRSLLNHEQWHQRHNTAFTNASSIAYMTPTGCLSTKSLGSSLSFASASANCSYTGSLISVMSSLPTYNFTGSRISALSSLPTSNSTGSRISVLSSFPTSNSTRSWISVLSSLPTSNSTGSRISVLSSLPTSNFTATTGPALPFPSASATTKDKGPLASLIDYIEDLEADILANWDDQTESACGAALIALQGVATNPSGIAACYNIQSLNNSTGIFAVDLRLYRIAAPKGDWMNLDPSSVGVGLAYSNATVSATKAKRAIKEVETLPWFPAQRDEAADIYIRRSTGVPPRRLGMMTFSGTVDDGSLADLANMATALSILTPSIILSGIEQDGTAIDTGLSTQDASFVNGIFASADPTSSQSKIATDANESILPGTQTLGFPIGLIVSSVWAVLYLMTMGYGTIMRYQERESYRRRVKNRFSGAATSKKFSGDTITKRRMRWA